MCVYIYIIITHKQVFHQRPGSEGGVVAQGRLHFTACGKAIRRGCAL